MAAPTKQEDILKDLMKKKDEVEDQIKLWHEVLNSVGYDLFFSFISIRLSIRLV